MASETNVSGHWVGDYFQNDGPHPITADLGQAGERVFGSMRDDAPTSVSTVFELAARLGLPPGADEQIVAGLRAKFPDAPSAPIQYVAQLPPDSTLEGWVKGSTVYFLKSYQGESFNGFQAGEWREGALIEGHTVHYRGKLSSDGNRIEGRWWIDPDTKSGVKRGEGDFVLHR